MHPVTYTSPHRLVEYDSIRRRVWILGQRCHHGASGALVAGCAGLGLVAETLPAGRPPIDARAMIVAALTGGVLMAHDWKDRSIWFERGHGTQPWPSAHPTAEHTRTSPPSRQRTPPPSTPAPTGH